MNPRHILTIITVPQFMKLSVLASSVTVHSKQEKGGVFKQRRHCL